MTRNLAGLDQRADNFIGRIVPPDVLPNDMYFTILDQTRRRRGGRLLQRKPAVIRVLRPGRARSMSPENRTSASASDFAPATSSASSDALPQTPQLDVV